jgi:hypothetical protein
MSIRSLLLVLTLSPPAFSCFAREESTWVGSVIDTVIVDGNTKTRTYVILDEMTLQAGMPVSAEALEFDRNRIYSLGLFTRVELRFDSLSTPRALYVLVAERWYIMPHIIFGFRDGDITKPYYGVGIYHTNVGGVIRSSEHRWRSGTIRHSRLRFLILSSIMRAVCLPG